jgi:Transglycosylase
VKPHKLVLRCFVALALVLSAVAAIIFVVARALAPAPGEWATTLRWGKFERQVGVPALVQLATIPSVARLVSGHTFATPAGPVAALWNDASESLQLRCQPCLLQHVGLGAEPIKLHAAELSVRRQYANMSGQVRLEAQGAQPPLKVDWAGRLTMQGIQLNIELPSTPIASAYALFAAHIPELATAHMEGTFAARATLNLPSGAFSVTPTVATFSVSGLGTEALIGARSACGPGAPLRADSWLARAVVAAEDQRFYEHPGFDVIEMQHAFSSQSPAKLRGASTPWQSLRGASTPWQSLRGASTITQQLAKLVLTGDERSAARKLRELLYAVEMERTLGKARILSLYLAHAPWGQGQCGAHSAAKHYFGVSPQRLSPQQAAWLAAMLHQPDAEASAWEQSGQVNLNRTATVLKAMRGMPRRQRMAFDLGEVRLARHVPTSR